MQYFKGSYGQYQYYVLYGYLKSNDCTTFSKKKKKLPYSRLVLRPLGHAQGTELQALTILDGCCLDLVHFGIIFGENICSAM